jgi:hypothetical protein
MRDVSGIASAQWSARLVILFLGVPSLGFAIVSGLFNANYAARLGHDPQERMTWVAASVFITLFVSGLPIGIEVLRAKVPHLATAARGLWLASLAFSFVAAMGYAAVTRGQATAEAGAALKARSAIEAAIARSEAEIAALPNHRPTSTVRGELRAAEATAGRALTLSKDCISMADRWQRDACRPILTLRAELAAAEDAARIEARLEVQRSQLSSLAVAGTSANPQADVLAWLSAGSLAAEVWEKLLTVFVAGLIELSAALGLAITARSVVELMKPEQAPAAVVEVPAAAIAQPTPVQRVEPELGWRMWFEGCVTPAKGSRVTAKEAYAHYETWAGLNGISDVVPLVTFGRRMTEALAGIGGRVLHSNGRSYEGISLARLGNAAASVIPEAAE